MTDKNTLKKISIYDTTLRDGTQAEEISFSLEDKLRITKKLDDLGVHYIEGGWPGSNPKDALYFEKVKQLKLKNAKVCAFGSTRRHNVLAKDDSNIKGLLKSGAKVLTIFGKSWDMQVIDALNITLAENLELIYDTINYLKSKRREVVFDAEHFFDGFKDNKNYAISVLKTAQKAGADIIVLCDTNGGTLPHEVEKIFKIVNKSIKSPLGMHAHNDAETAVANSLVAVLNGVNHVHGTINGFGERCGNANLCSIIPNIKLKLNMEFITDIRLEKLRETSRFVNELANLNHLSHQPFVGKSAFAHKGGIHVSAVKKNSRTYEHIEPGLVGNHRRVLVSELSGQSNILHKAKEYGLDIQKGSDLSKKILKRLKTLENEGFQFEGAEASFELLMKEALGTKKKYFLLKGYRLIVEKRKENEIPISEATVKVVVDGVIEHTVSEGNGPVNALDNALRKALERFYPVLKSTRLLDYKVRILDGGFGTKAKTRVLIETGDSHHKWGTVGVSDNIIDASWQALLDGIDYKLNKTKC